MLRSKAMTDFCFCRDELLLPFCTEDFRDISLTALLKKLCDEAGPASLMARAKAGAVVSKKVFVKKNQAAPVRICLELLNATSHRTAPVFATQEDTAEAL